MRSSFLVLGVIVACATDKDDATPNADRTDSQGDLGETDTDTDTDSDTDADTDTDSDTDADTDADVDFTLASPDMEAHNAGPCFQQLPQFAECTNFGGQNLNPQLDWLGVPVGTVSLALVLDDVVFAPQGDPYDHWVVYDIDPSVTSIPQASSGTDPTGKFPDAEQLTSYFGSCSNGQNTYRWRLFAFDATMDPAPTSAEDVETFALTHQLGVASMCHCPEGDCFYY